MLAGLYSSVRTFDLQRQTKDVQRQSEQSQEQGQINERFTKAIDQLGAVLPGAAVEKNGTAKINLEVRLGGIYALEQIAKDAPEKYHWTVVEVLSAYVRENAHWVEAERPESGIEMDVMSRPRADVQAALAVIGRREVTHDPPGRSIDLSVTDLKGVNLIGAHLGSADLRGTYLGRAYVGRAYLEKAGLRFAHLEGADLRQAHLRGALLEGAGFIDEKLYRAAQLDGLDLSRAEFNGTDLRGADLRDVKGMTDDQLEGMRGDVETRLSSGVRRPAAWSH